MLTRRNRWGLTALALAIALVLAACTPPDQSTGLPDHVTIGLSLGGDLDAQSLAPQGSPYDPSTGELALETVHVSVYSGGDLVTFTDRGGTYVASATGSIEFVTLSTGAGGVADATVELPAAGNPYTFVSHGYADVTEPVIAYASQTQNVSDAATVWIRPDSVLGGARLVPRLPTTYATPGEVLDLMLEVAANGHEGFGEGYLQVPLGDFEASYDTTVEVVASSNRGIRVRVPAECSGELSVTVNVRGLVEAADGFVVDDLAPVEYAIDCPPRVGGSVQVDNERPEVTIDGYDAATREVVGTASDDVGIAKVQVFDGGVLLASTDEAEATGDVAIIAFPGGGNTFRTTLRTAPYGGIVAYAFDTSGNEGRSEELASPNQVWVDVGGSGDGTGSESAPFTSLQAALDAVNAGGKVFVAPGTYVEQLRITKDLTIVGAGVGETIIRAPDVMHPAEGEGATARFPIIDVAGAGVTARVSGITVQGPFGTAGGGGTGCQMMGVRVKDGVLYMSDSEVVGARQEPFSGNQCGTGIQVGRDLDSHAGTAYLTDVDVRDFQKTGIFVDGVGSTLHMSGGTVSGHGDTTVTAQNGIQVSRGASAFIDGVTVHGANYGPTSWGASGLLLYLSSAVEVRNSTFFDNDVNVYITPDSQAPVLRGNRFDGADDADVVVMIPDAIDLTQGNTFSGVDPATASDADLFAIEDRIYHGADDASFGLARLVPGRVFVTPNSGGVQVGVNAASAGDVVVVAPGDYTAEGVVLVPASKAYLTLEGAGAKVRGFDVRADGVTLDGFEVELDANAQVVGVTVAARNVTLNGLDIYNAATFDDRTNGFAVQVPTGADASGFTMTGGSIANVTYGVFADTAVTTPTTLTGVLIEDVSLSDVTWKGMYFEALADATIRDVTMENVGWYGGGIGTGQEGSWGTGIDINLKYGDYANIALEGVSATDTGWSYGTASGAGDKATDSDPNGAAIAIRARNDGGYAAAPATLTNVVIDGLDVTESRTGVRFGEPGKDNEHVGAVVRNSTFTAPSVAGVTAYGIVNESVSDVDATTGNAFDGVAVWDGSDAAGRGEVHGAP